jgi:hypothetical protein
MSDPVHVEPRAGHQAAALCDEAASELAELAAEVGDVPLSELLGWHVENLTEFAARFRSVDAAYGEADRGCCERYPS